MAIIVNVAGPVLTKVGFPLNLSDLGYTRGGTDIRYESFMLDVPGDENGGEEGTPIEVQYLGEIASIRLELTKYDPVTAANVKARLAGATAGTPGTPGTLFFATNKTMRVCLVGTNETRNFNRCICREPVEINKGTKFSTLVLEFTAYKDANGVLWNTSSS